MATVINLRKRRGGWWKTLVVVLSAVGLTTLGIKASDRLFSSDEPGKQNGPCPEEMVPVAAAGGDFCLDRYEASAGSGCPAKEPGGQAQSLENLDAPGCRPEAVKGAKPWRNLSQNQAAEACAKAGKRLPTNKEWLQAAYGTPDPASGWRPDDCQVAKNWTEQPGPAGSGGKCVSAAGAYDMIGNVWEWTDGTVTEGRFNGKILPGAGYVTGVDDEALPSATREEGGDENYHFDYLWLKATETRGMARGGYWDNQAEAGQYSLYVVTPPSFAGVGIGFRCAK